MHRLPAVHFIEKTKFLKKVLYLSDLTQFFFVSQHYVFSDLQMNIYSVNFTAV